MIRFVLRWVFRFTVLGVALVVLLGAAAYFLEDQILREYLAYRLRVVTGLPSRIDQLHAELRRGTLTLSGLQLVNAPEFGGSALLTVPELHLELDTVALAHREIRFQLVRLHLAEFNVIRNERGQTNVVELMDGASRRAGVGDAAVVSPPGFEFAGIDTLDLTVGAVRFAQLGPTGGTREIKVGLTNEIVRNVRTIQDLMPLVLRVAVREVAAGLRTDFAPSSRPANPSTPSTPRSPAPSTGVTRPPAPPAPRSSP